MPSTGGCPRGKLLDAEIREDLMAKLTLSTRVTTLERDVRDHSKTLTSIIDRVSASDARLSVLENAHMDGLIKAARQEERDISLEKRLKSMEGTLEKILGVGAKTLWLFAASLVTAIVLFTINGGLTLTN